MKQTTHIEKVKASHRKIYTDIVINAPASSVWEVLKDTPSYSNWAAFMVKLEGELTDGNTIKATFQLNPAKAKFTSVEHTIQVVEERSFYWAEKGPMGICDNHHFIVEAIDDRTSRFIQSDELTQGATWLLGGYLSKIYLKGYQDFNQKLKKEAESRLGKS